MSSANPVATKKFFSLDEANKTLPLVKQIVGDIVRQFQIVNELDTRLSGVLQRDAKRRRDDPYTEELAHTKTELEGEEEKLNAYREELEKLGVELKGTDGLCDFPSLKDGREVYLCWRLGEDSVIHWHEVNAGFAGRQSIATLNTPPRPGRQR
ncbi:MAG: hypothetical protein JWN86_3873 [Planctomycetota bacterium]|nr:hypothetical protein [Planctomycetota bacterium]